MSVLCREVPLYIFTCLGGADSRNVPGVPDEAAEIGGQLHPEVTGADCTKGVGERMPTGCVILVLNYIDNPVVCLNKLLDV